MAPVYKDETMDSMFTIKEPAQHKFLKSSVAQYFSMTNMRNYEKYADECTDIFIKAMKDLEGQQLDLAIWLQWYAFDVIGSITFQSRFGFMEQRKDIDSMIARIDAGLKYYVGIIGQFPHLHPYLGGNTKLTNFLTSHIQGAKDPLRGFFDVYYSYIT
jgi:cytochrome P450